MVSQFNQSGSCRPVPAVIEFLKFNCCDFLVLFFLTALSFENESVRNENNRLSFNDGTRINAGQQFQGFNNLGVANDLDAEGFNQGSAFADNGLQFEVSKHVN